MAKDWSGSAERSIHFFRADAGLGTAGQPVPLDVEPILKLIDSLAFREDERYVALDDGNVLSCVVDSTYARPRLQLATVRRTDLPTVESAGALSALALGTGQGLYEATHVIFFSNNVVGVEFNFYGPRPSRVSWYMSKATKGKSPTFTLDPLLRQDVLEQLNRLERLRVLTLAIRPSYATVVEEADQNLAGAFRAAERAGQSQLVKLTLSPEPYQKGWLANGLLTTIRRLAIRSDLRENARKFEVRGLNGQTSSMEEVDVLRDQLIVRKRIVKLDSHSRAVNDEAAYRAIEEAYAELRVDLEAAAAAAVAAN